jgi:hypothetical protein
MIKTIFLVPERDNRGRRFPTDRWNALEQRLIAFGGASRRFGVQGFWEFGGRVYRDRSREYTVGLSSWFQLAAWLETITWMLEAFEQEAIYFEVAGVPEIAAKTGG